MHLLIALSLFAAGAGQHEAPSDNPDPQLAEVERAGTLIREGKPSEGIAVLDTLIAAQEKERAADRRRAYCARSPAEARTYEAAAAKERQRIVVLPQSACYSLYLKGFALVDLHRPDQAKIWYDRAVAMAPRNSHFLGEMGEWYKTRHEWTQARAWFEKAREASELSPDDRKSNDKRRAMRGIGFVLIENGTLDEAEKIFRDVLAIDPNDDHAQRELQYISEHRGKKI
jgi:tetratricopeptide (TPR) repeat protein